MLLLQLLQFAEQLVVLGVGDLRLVEYVVAVRVVMQQLAQGIRAFLDAGGRGHGHEKRRRACGDPADTSRASSVSYRCSRSAPITSSASARITWPLSSVMRPSIDAASAIAASRMRTNGCSLRAT